MAGDLVGLIADAVVCRLPGMSICSSLGILTAAKARAEQTRPAHPAGRKTNLGVGKIVNFDETLFQMPRKTCKTTDFQMENRDFEP